VHPNGTTVVFSARTPHPGSDSIYCGFNCVGIYAYENGMITRLSDEPTGCVDRRCAGFNIYPRIGADGALYYQVLYIEPSSSGGSSSITVEYRMEIGSEPEELPAGECGQTSDPPEPNPVVGGEYAISNYCVDDGGGYALMIQDLAGNSEKLFFDDAAFSNVTYRGDGQMLAAAESGADAGVWTYPRGDGTPAHVLALTYTPDNGAFDTNLSFVGSSRLAFAWGDAIRTVPTTCDACTLADTALVVQANDLSGLAWTSRTIPVPAPPQPGPSPTPAPNPPGPGAGPGGGTGTGAGDGAASGPAATLSAVRAPRLASALRSGVRVPFTARGAGRLTLVATVSGKVAKQLKLVRKATRKPVVVARGSASLAAPGAGTATLKFTKAAGKRLARARSVTVSVDATFGAAKLPASTITLRR
jgi:hypothetical protein